MEEKQFDILINEIKDLKGEMKVLNTRIDVFEEKLEKTKIELKQELAETKEELRQELAETKVELKQELKQDIKDEGKSKRYNKVIKVAENIDMKTKKQIGIIGKIDSTILTNIILMKQLLYCLICITQIFFYVLQ